MAIHGVACDGVRADGARCGQLARVLGTRYIYGLAADENGKPVRALRETRISIQCPRCGLREMVVRHDHLAD